MKENFTKKFYVENVEAWEKTLSQKRLSDRKLEVKVIEHGIILPARPAQGTWEGGVCDNDFNFIAGFTRRDPFEKYGGGVDLLLLNLPTPLSAKKLFNSMKM